VAKRGEPRRLLDSTEERKDFNEARSWLSFCRLPLVRPALLGQSDEQNLCTYCLIRGLDHRPAEH
ncbi:MAG: hypothetical protein ACRELF_05140, partial [Gemmataceae bacterium]